MPSSANSREPAASSTLGTGRSCAARSPASCGVTSAATAKPARPSFINICLLPPVLPFQDAQNPTGAAQKTAGSLSYGEDRLGALRSVRPHQLKRQIFSVPNLIQEYSCV